jgi:galactokinase
MYIYGYFEVFIYIYMYVYTYVHVIHTYIHMNYYLTTVLSCPKFAGKYRTNEVTFVKGATTVNNSDVPTGGGLGG